MGPHAVPHSGAELSALAPIWHPSPNFGARRDGLTPAFIVLHYTAMSSAEEALARLCNPKSEVSAHYLIARDGRVWQMVEEPARAWHAGAGSWHGLTDLNSRSIGVELDNGGFEPFAEPQMAALEHLLVGIMRRWDLRAEAVIAHSDLAPGRKTDPGPKFDWRRLSRQRLAAETPREGPYVSDMNEALRQSGYTGDVDAPIRLAAFRLRHAPWNSGPIRDDERKAAGALAKKSSSKTFGVEDFS